MLPLNPSYSKIVFTMLPHLLGFVMLTMHFIVHVIAVGYVLLRYCMYWSPGALALSCIANKLEPSNSVKMGLGKLQELFLVEHHHGRKRS